MAGCSCRHERVVGSEGPHDRQDFGQWRIYDLARPVPVVKAVLEIMMHSQLDLPGRKAV
jgi:hypothetical protein